MQEEVKSLPGMARVRTDPAISELRAINPVNGHTAWRVKLAGWQDRGGVLATAGGLVFEGSVDGSLNVFDAQTGKKLQSIQTGVAIEAVQYVAVLAGWGGGGWPYVPDYSATVKYGPLDRIFVFKLDGSAMRLPPPLPPLTVAPPAPPQLPGATPQMIAAGRDLFFANCVICHANQPRSVSPDLRRLDPTTHRLFRQIVRGGLLVAGGMPRWNDLLTDADTDAIHAWLINTQAALHTRELALQRAGLKLDTKSAAILSSY
jgi:quinohemoprotein ethanol dehydrogenase